MVTLYHPALDASVTVAESTARTLEKSGWTEKKPRRRRAEGQEPEIAPGQDEGADEAPSFVEDSAPEGPTEEGGLDVSSDE